MRGTIPNILIPFSKTWRTTSYSAISVTLPVKVVGKSWPFHIVERISVSRNKYVRIADDSSDVELNDDFVTSGN
jgi:hypothetical protein